MARRLRPCAGAPPDPGSWGGNCRHRGVCRVHRRRRRRRRGHGGRPRWRSGPGGVSGTSMTQAACTTLSPGATPLRRLTQPEYNNTVRDLLGDTSSPRVAFPPDQRQGDFSNTAVALTVSPLLAQSYETAAETLATTALEPPLHDRRLRHDHDGRGRLRDAVHHDVRQARVPAAAHDRRAVGAHGPLRDEPSAARLQQRHPVRHRGRPAVGALPLPPRVRHGRASRRGPSCRSRRTRWPRACRTSSGARCPTTCSSPRPTRTR